MIITKKVKIKSSNKDKNYYTSLGYNTTNDFEINIEDLKKGSGKKIKVKCDICGKEKEIEYRRYIENTSDLKENYCCSRKCANYKCKQRLINKYGVINVFQLNDIKEKSKETKKKLYFDSNFINIEKRKKTNLKKYGCEEHLSNSEIREKIKNTCLDKYGVDCIVKYKNIKNSQIKKTKISKFEKSKKYYKEKYDLDLIDFDNKDYKFNCKKGHQFLIKKSLLKNRLYHLIEVCTICNPIGLSFISQGEKELRNFIEKYIDNVQLTNRDKIHPYHLDLYLPDLNIAFEYNGVYWHNDKNKGKYYHKNKSKFCKDKGIELIHIWENDWKERKEIVKSIILKKLNINEINIYDNYIIKKINKDIVNEFIFNNSLKDRNSIYGYGLYYKNELVSIISVNENNNIMHVNKKFRNIKNSFNLLIKNIEFNYLIIYNDFEDYNCYEYFKKFFVLKNRKMNNFNIYDSGKYFLKLNYK